MFDGETFDTEKDQQRLTTLLERVRDLMIDGEWRPLWAIAVEARGSEASVSARLRDLRKPRFGCYQVERRRVHQGTHHYRVLPPAVVPTRDPLALPAQEIAHQIVCEFLAR